MWEITWFFYFFSWLGRNPDAYCNATEISVLMHFSISWCGCARSSSSRHAVKRWWNTVPHQGVFVNIYIVWILVWFMCCRDMCNIQRICSSYSLLFFPSSRPGSEVQSVGHDQTDLHRREVPSSMLMTRIPASHLKGMLQSVSYAHMEVRIVLVFMKLLFYIFTMHDPF